MHLSDVHHDSDDIHNDNDDAHNDNSHDVPSGLGSIEILNVCPNPDIMNNQPDNHLISLYPTPEL